MKSSEEWVGAGRRELEPFLDAVIWVQCDLDETLARDQARIASGELSREVYEQWIAQELPFQFQCDQRTWERAAVVVAGNTQDDLDPASEVVVSQVTRDPGASGRHSSDAP